MPHRSIRTIVADQELFTLPGKTTVSEAARLMKKSSVGAVMVVEERRLVGIFTERDGLFRVLATKHDPRTTKLADVMTRNPKTIHPDKAFGHALLIMYEGGFRHVPVVEDGRPLGMISARDALGPDLEAFQSELSQQEHLREIIG